MASSWPTINTLKISMLFLQSTDALHYCQEVQNTLKMPSESVRDGLRLMAEASWLERVESTGKERFYRLTEVGHAQAIAALTPLQLPAIMASV